MAHQASLLHDHDAGAPRPKARVMGSRRISAERLSSAHRGSREPHWGKRAASCDIAVAKTKYTFDAANRVLTETNPLLKATTWTYDGDGNAKTKLDANGHLTTFSFVDAGRRREAAQEGHRPGSRQDAQEARAADSEAACQGRDGLADARA
jgi:YD repeat-containing protein